MLQDIRCKMLWNYFDFIVGGFGLEGDRVDAFND